MGGTACGQIESLESYSTYTFSVAAVNADGVGAPASIVFTTPIGARVCASRWRAVAPVSAHSAAKRHVRTPRVHAGTVSDWIALHTLLFALVVAFSGTLSIALSIVAIWRVYFGPARAKTMTPSTAVLPPPVDVRTLVQFNSAHWQG